jgi:hypothetical protein
MISWLFVLLTAGSILLLFALVAAFFVGRALAYRHMWRRSMER